MKIVQLLPTISFGDAVGNDTLSIRDILLEQGYETGIYAENIDRRLPRGAAEYTNRMPQLSDNDILIYHASTGTQLNYDLPKYGGKKVMIYHNITPPHFFEGYSKAAAQLTARGYEGVRFLSDKVDYVIAVSDYNRRGLLSMGYTCPIDVCPILIPFDDYAKKPNQGVLDRYANDGWTNLLFVGRIAPNKKQEDVIRAFYCYQRRYNPKSRLFLVGSSNGMEGYLHDLHAYTEVLGIANKVIFPGHIRFDEILAYYTLADAFVCMSEHEGFCVPLVEAMLFHVPIVAYASSAIPETLGDGGLSLRSKDPELCAAAINRIIYDDDLRKRIDGLQQRKLIGFHYENVKARLIASINRVINIMP